MAPPPPPPPPPLCFPFSSKPKRRLTFSELSARESYDSQRSSVDRLDRNRLDRSGSYSPTATLTSRAEKLTFTSETDSYASARNYSKEVIEVKPNVLRRNTTKSRVMKDTAPPAQPAQDAPKPAGEKPKRHFTLLGYGWGLGKKEKERQRELEMQHQEDYDREEDLIDLTRDGSPDSHLPAYQSPRPSEGTQKSPRSSNGSSHHSSERRQPLNPLPPHMLEHRLNNRSDSYKSNSSRSTDRSGGSGMRSGRSAGSSKRPGLESSQSSDTLVGSAYERKVSDLDPIPERVDTTGRLTALRELMQKETLDYYIIPTEDAHGSEYVAINDKRREWISGFTGSAGQAIISRTNAYLATDARYWIQARDQLDENWILIEAGSVGGPADWISWLSDRAKDARIGIDSRMVSYEKATKLNQALVGKSCKLVYPPQNLVDLIWAEKPSRSKEPIFVQPHQFTGKEAGAKLAELRVWIGNQAPTVPSYSKEPPKPSQMQVATLISSLPSIAYALNLRGDDIPFNPVFHAYLFVSLTQAILFIEPAKVSKEVDEYLQSIGVERMEYNEIWGFIRRKPWGEGKVIITPETSYAISLILTSFRYTALPSYVDEMKAIKNRSEIEGLQHAYLRDGCAFVRFLAWLEEKIRQGYEITEYEAAWRLTEYRRKQAHYMGLAYENISASGPNAALPHYSPRKSTAIYIDKKTPYLNDSGGQYQDGTCDTTRTVHFGQPTDAQCEAFTRVLQGHIAIDSAIFPEGTSGAKLDVLARRALWQDGLNYMHGTGHGVGSYLTVHEGPHGFSSDVPLKPGHVITNEPGFYKEGEWGIRIESALFVKPVTTRGEFNGAIWLGFERLTCVPIQTKMVKDVMLSKEERQWLKSHNARCLDLLTPLLQEQNDQRALKWLRREASRGIGAAKSGPGGISIDWD